MSDFLDKQTTSRRQFSKAIALAAGGIVAGAVVGCKKEEKTPEAGAAGAAGAAAKAKHECAGKNACKGLGGCKSSDNGCKGKNSCAGKGGCNSSH